MSVIFWDGKGLYSDRICLERGTLNRCMMNKIYDFELDNGDIVLAAFTGQHSQCMVAKAIAEALNESPGRFSFIGQLPDQNPEDVNMIVVVISEGKPKRLMWFNGSLTAFEFPVDYPVFDGSAGAQARYCYDSGLRGLDILHLVEKHTKDISGALFANESTGYRLCAERIARQLPETSN